MKSERSSQKQHFFSHFKQFQLKMRCKMENVVLNFEIQCKNENKDGKWGFRKVCVVLTTKYTQIQLLQRIFSWNCLKCEKKCCFCEERSDFILSHMSEILSEFAQIEVWWRWISLFSGKARKNRFRAIWALNMLQIAKMPQKFPWAIIPSVAYLKSKMSEILIFSNFSKNQLSVLIILENG